MCTAMSLRPRQESSRDGPGSGQRVTTAVCADAQQQDTSSRRFLHVWAKVSSLKSSEGLSGDAGVTPLTAHSWAPGLCWGAGEGHSVCRAVVTALGPQPRACTPLANAPRAGSSPAPRKLPLFSEAPPPARLPGSSLLPYPVPAAGCPGWRRQGLASGTVTGLRSPGVRPVPEAAVYYPGCRPSCGLKPIT